MNKQLLLSLLVATGATFLPSRILPAAASADVISFKFRETEALYTAYTHLLQQNRDINAYRAWHQHWITRNQTECPTLNYNDWWKNLDGLAQELGQQHKSVYVFSNTSADIAKLLKAIQPHLKQDDIIFLRTMILCAKEMIGNPAESTTATSNAPMTATTATNAGVASAATAAAPTHSAGMVSRTDSIPALRAAYDSLKASATWQEAQKAWYDAYQSKNQPVKLWRPAFMSIINMTRKKMDAAQPVDPALQWLAELIKSQNQTDFENLLSILRIKKVPATATAPMTATTATNAGAASAATAAPAALAKK